MARAAVFPSSFVSGTQIGRDIFIIVISPGFGTIPRIAEPDRRIE
jgi:hypothetical protein